ncbi:MAG: NAD(P)/FAD-dependent oxidoreductase [Gemmatimonadales bacterium]
MPTRLVLVGAGHAHLAVLDALARHPIEEIETTIVSTDPRQFHPALLPEVIRGTAPFESITVDVAALARRAGARIQVATATGLDRDRREVRLGDGMPLRYDVVSIATGAGLIGADREGVRTWALMSRPAAEAAAMGPALDGLVRRKAGDSIHLAVVGGGADAIELALAARTRLSSGGGQVRTAILAEDERLLSGWPGVDGVAMGALLTSRGVVVRVGTVVESVAAGELVLRGRERVPADAVIWANAPAPLPFARASGLAADQAGAIRADAWLRSVDDPLVFAAGHVATVDGRPVDPIRSGSILAHNLLCVCTGAGPLRKYVHRRRPLLLTTGAGRARFAWGPLSLEAGWIKAIKGRRDTAYIARFK